jgi:dipeptidyl aminopeptidase/acylaminoacyl peptidase
VAVADRWLRVFVCAAAVVLPRVASSQGASASSRAGADAVFDQLGAAHRIIEAALSPDGRQVAWLEQAPGGGGHATTSLNLSTLGGPAVTPRTLRLGKGRTTPAIRDVAWSVDGRRLVLLSDAETPGQLQILVVDVARGAPRRLTRLAGELGLPRFSPDGEAVAFLFTADARAAAGPTAAKPAETGVIGERMDVQRLAIVDLRSGRVRTVSPGNLYIHEFDWAPDGKRWVATAAPPPGDDGWYASKLYAIDATTGEATVIFAPPTQIGGPRVSPDGKSVAFIAGLMSDEAFVGGEAFVVPASGGQARNLTPGRPTSVSCLRWRPSSRELLVAEFVDGGSGLASIDVASGRIEPLWRGAERLSALPGNPGPSLAVAADGATTAVVRQSFVEPPELWAGPIGAWTQVSRANPQASRLWGEAKSLTWKSDGLDVEGWLVAPRALVAGRRYPLVVDVHGGPAGAWLPSWPGNTSRLALASDGFFVFLPNPRGSFGRGQAFTRGNVKDWHFVA